MAMKQRDESGRLQEESFMDYTQENASDAITGRTMVAVLMQMRLLDRY